MTTVVPSRFAPRDSESSFRDGGWTWTVLMIDPVNWLPRRDEFEVLWRIGHLKDQAGEVHGTILGWYYADADGIDTQARFEICEVAGRPAVTHFEIFALHDRAVIPAMSLPADKLAKHASIVGHVVGDAAKKRGKWTISVREYRSPAGVISERLPRKHRAQLARCFDAYTSAPYGQRGAAVRAATGLGVDSVNKLIKEMKKDREFGPMFRAWEKQMKGDKK
jgi:hypothetical protein